MLLNSYDLSVVEERFAPQSESSLQAAVARESPNRAAVAAILREGPLAESDAEILFIRRAERPRDPWSGHMAFPGGRHDPRDASLLDTAIRETREEVGLDLASHGKLLWRLPVVEASTRRTFDMIVAPFVFSILRGESNLVSNAEVAEAIWTPLGPLARGETSSMFEYQQGEAKLQFPSLLLGDRVVWGLTYRILQTLLDVVHATT
ncbi:MAG TPA: CoA pyrophosphatase [Polyangiaceae bacterium]|nr:CoA pyrophosphatase [Polyangiaceae bacterium]